MKKYLSIILIILMIITLIPSYAMETTKNDIAGHWAETTIEKWKEKQLMKGYPDGTFRPDDNMTKAEFITLINRIYGYYEKTEKNYTDIQVEDWYRDDISIAKANQYMNWYKEKTLQPNDKITRQEVCAIISEIQQLEATEKLIKLNSFNDKELVPQWSKTYIDAVVNSGYMKGYPDNTIKAEGSITRAEVVTMLNRVVGELINVSGTYGTEDKEQIIEGNLTINTQGVILKNTTINGNLILAAGIGQGDVDLENVTVKGKTIINGGGENSITITGSNLGEIRVYKIDGKIRVVLADSKAESVILQSGGKLEGEYKDTEITIDPEDGQKVILDGNFDSLAVDSKVDIQLTGGSSIKEITFNAEAEVTGKGKIEKAILNANGVQIEQKVEDKKVAPGINDDGVNENKPSSSGNKNSSGGSSYTKSSLKQITGTQIGVLHNGNIIEVPESTKVSTFKDGLTVSSKATVEILENGNPVSNPEGTDVTENMIIQVTAENGTKAQFTITLKDESLRTTSFIPANNAIDVQKNIDLKIIFNKNIQGVSGKNIKIYQSSDDTQVRTISAIDAQVAIHNNIATINLNQDLELNQQYYVLIEEGAFVNKTDVSKKYEGITNNTAWTFTTGADKKAPIVTSFTPADNAVGVTIDTNLEITFDEEVQSVNGKSIRIYQANNDTQVRSIAAIDAQVTNNKVTIDLGKDLDYETQYYVLIEQGAFKDKAETPNEYVGISDKTTWNFTTNEAPPAYVGKLQVQEGDAEGSIKFTVEINKNGKVYYTITDKILSSLPSAEDIKNENISDALKTGNQNLTANTAATITIDSLLPDKDHYVYLVAEGATNSFIQVKKLTAKSKIVQGDGLSQSTPYKIWYIEDLAKIGTDTWEMDDYYILMRNLDFNDENSYRSYNNNFTTGEGWDPIGDDSNPLTGSFNGNRKTINRLYIDRPSGEGIGLFAMNGGNIKDLGIENVNIVGKDCVGAVAGINEEATIENCYSTGNIEGNEGAGGLAGINLRMNNGGVIRNSYSSANITAVLEGVSDDAGGIVGLNVNGTIENCYSTGTIISARDNAGGIAGKNEEGIIISCYSTGDIKAGRDNAGGIAGDNGYYDEYEDKDYYGTIKNSYSTGAIIANNNAGGITGNNIGTVENSYSTGTITAKSDYAGGIAGGNDEGIIRNSYSTGDITATDYAGGIAGYNDVTITNSYSIGDITAYYAGGIAGYNEGTIKNDCAFNNKIIGNSKIYRLVGKNEFGTLSNNYAKSTMLVNGSTTSSSNVNSLSGKDITLTEFKDISFYSANLSSWDYTNAWEIKDGADRPTLKGIGNDDGKIVVKKSSEKSIISTSIGILSGNSIEVPNGTKVSTFKEGLTVSDKATVEILEHSQGSAVLDQSNTDVTDEMVVQVTAEDTTTSEYTITISTSIYKSAQAQEGDNEGEIKFTIEINEDGKVYFAITDKRLSSLPSAEDIKNGNVSDALETGNESLTSNTAKTITIQDLLPDKAHYIYLVAENTSNNLAEVKELTAISKIVQGDGSASKPFKIWYIEDLTTIGKVSATGTWDKDGYYLLERDLNFEDKNSYRNNEADFTTGDGWDPIDDFSGNFNGNGKTISGLFINRIDESHIGLFAENEGTIKDLGVLSVNITGKSSVGGIAGENFYGTIANSYSTGNITANNDNAGGITGENYHGTITNSYSTGDITANQSKAGGIAGFNYGTIENSYSTGNITANQSKAGGITGENGYNETITNSYSTGNITGDIQSGGIAGSNRGTIENCYSTGNIIVNQYYAGGIAGDNYNASIKNSCAFNGIVQIGFGSSIGRVTGEKSGNSLELANNYAKSTMVVKISDSIISDTSDSGTEWGADIDIITDMNSLPLSSWDFKDTDGDPIIWEIKPGAARPTLKGVGNDNGKL